MKKYFNKQNITATISIIVVVGLMVYFVFETAMAFYDKYFKP